ncbi:coiled-coil domain-containing protein 187 isoform X1 [Latimeria chalumnae]|uniref:coiled-coil domain-containing protein 187 isoform X1 n=1 Tax=Latimeria chalumnae TaxID=7897 RepID=UPI00313D853C
MTDIDIDQSHLPRVREVCEGFAVLEDGALAHFLQEQEIENYYASNIEKNQLVQKDIRIAKKLQGEENEYCRQLTEHQQRLVEERDLEYARAIQEELQLQAAEHRRREEEDGEIAKQLQEEEERQTEKPSLRSLHHGDEEDSNRVPEHNRSQSYHHFCGDLDSGCSENVHSRRRADVDESYTRQTSAGRSSSSRRRRRRSEHHESEREYSQNYRRDCSDGILQNHEDWETRHCNQSHNGRTHSRERRGSRIDPHRSRRESFSDLENGCSGGEFGSVNTPSGFRQDRGYRERRRSRRAERREKLSRWHDERCGPSSSEDEEPRELEARGRVKRHSSHGQPQECRRPRSVTNQSASSSGKRSPTTDEGSWQWQGPSLLERGMARVEIEDHEQLLQDEELARRLQEEEEKRLVQIRSQSRQKQEEDYRAAQVAQDEEIAKYMQRQEIKAQQRAKEREMCRNSPQEDAEDDSHSMERERSWDRKNELACTHPGRLNSEGLLSPTEDWTLKQPESPNQTAGDTGTKPVFPRNVAEELDPTFQAKRRENPAEMATRASAGAVRCQSAPVDGFYDYLDDGSEAAFVLPTKRQTDKSGRQKTRDKKEGCKQQ